MQKLVYYQMRISAILLLLIVSSAIIYSYIRIPSILAISLSDFYKEYWYLLTKLFAIAAIFLLFAYSVEREWMATSWPQRVIAFSLIALFIKEFVELIDVVGLLLAFVS